MTEDPQIRCRLSPDDINTYEVIRTSDGHRIASFDISCELGENLVLALFQGLMVAGALTEEALLASFANRPTAH